MGGWIKRLVKRHRDTDIEQLLNKTAINIVNEFLNGNGMEYYLYEIDGQRTVAAYMIHEVIEAFMPLEVFTALKHLYNRKLYIDERRK